MTTLGCLQNSGDVLCEVQPEDPFCVAAVDLVQVGSAEDPAFGGGQKRRPKVEGVVGGEEDPTGAPSAVRAPVNDTGDTLPLVVIHTLVRR
jgi:hypothetical protein